MSDIDERYLEPRKEIREAHRDSASVEITEKNLWKGNEDGRKFANKLSTIIKNVGANAPAVILLEGEWGTGKTHFLKSFQIELIKKQSYRAIYFDAYAEDFSADPLLAICGQLWKELGDNSRTQRNLIKALNSFMALGETAFPPLIVIKKIWGIIKKRPVLLEEYVNSRKKLKGLKDELSKVAKSQPQEGESKPLVFIIDELDRCRPTFALELLERIKHLFQVEGIIFILGANKKSLTESIKLEYGLQDSDYLQKFFDLELKLPHCTYPSHIASKYQDFIINYEVLKDDNGLGNTKLCDTDIIGGLYYPLMDIMGITLRQAQRVAQMFLHCLSTLSTSISTEKPYDHKIVALICLILLKAGRPELYADFTKQKITGENVLEKIIPLIEKWEIKEWAHYNHDELETCRFFFTRAIYSMADEEERKEIIESNLSKRGYTERWDIKEELLNRSEIVAMLENLDCQNPFPS